MEPVLKFENLVVNFSLDSGKSVAAVRDFNLELKSGEVCAIAGESGSGKTQCFLGALGLLAKNGTASGRVMFNDQDLLKLRSSQLDKIRGNGISMIFQDPMTSLNPYLRLSVQLTEGLRRHQGLSFAAARERAITVLDDVGIPEAEQRFSMYPYELSGGLRQRVMIAMALLENPKVLIADEPTTALDVTIQAQILKLFAELKEKFSTALVLITHDLGVVSQLADKVAIMYAGRIVEQGDVESVMQSPQHPYTKGLIKSTPYIGVSRDRLKPIDGNPPNLEDIPVGCAFADRCELCRPRCKEAMPDLVWHNNRARACFASTQAVMQMS